MAETLNPTMETDRRKLHEAKAALLSSINAFDPLEAMRAHPFVTVAVAAAGGAVAGKLSNTEAGFARRLTQSRVFRSGVSLLVQVVGKYIHQMRQQKAEESSSEESTQG